MPLIPRQNSAEDAAQKIRNIVTRTGRQATQALRQINAIVKRQGRSNVEVALGEDAADLVAFHADVSGMALKYVGLEVDPLPVDPPPEEEEEGEGE